MNNSEKCVKNNHKPGEPVQVQKEFIFAMEVAMNSKKEKMYGY